MLLMAKLQIPAGKVSRELAVRLSFPWVSPTAKNSPILPTFTFEPVGASLPSEMGAFPVLGHRAVVSPGLHLPL